MDSRRLPLIAIVFIVLLRLAIGWQFLYEGMWKYLSLSSPEPWTAEGYLKNAQGPFRDTFRSMVGDPDELGWLDYANVSSEWYDWRDRFVAHYGLDENQQARLNIMLDGVRDKLADPAADPPDVSTSRKIGRMPTIDWESKDLKKKVDAVLTYDAKTETLKTSRSLLPSEEGVVLALIPQLTIEDGATAEQIDAREKLRAEFKKLAESSRKAVGYRHKLAAQLRGNPETVGVSGARNKSGSFSIVMGTTTASEESAERTNVQYGKIQEYKDLLADYEDAVSKARMEYQHDHAAMLKKKLTGLRNDVVGPVRTLDSELKNAAFGLLTTDQLARGSLAPADSPLQRASSRAMWGLLILGTLLLLGLGTRFAAVAGAVMVLSFYLVIPPFPGVPQPPAPEHSLIINKNLIEVIALLGIAGMPTGTWFGIDGLIGRWLKSRPASPTPPAAKPVATAPPTPQPAKKA